jgi:hypothetical protein
MEQGITVSDGGSDGNAATLGNDEIYAESGLFAP